MVYWNGIEIEIKNCLSFIAIVGVNFWNLEIFMVYMFQSQLCSYLHSVRIKI